jgi:hypothetical protein
MMRVHLQLARKSHGLRNRKRERNDRKEPKKKRVT